MKQQCCWMQNVAPALVWFGFQLLGGGGSNLYFTQREVGAQYWCAHFTPWIPQSDLDSLKSRPTAKQATQNISVILFPCRDQKHSLQVNSSQNILQCHLVCGLANYGQKSPQNLTNIMMIMYYLLILCHNAHHSSVSFTTCSTCRDQWRNSTTPS